MAETDARHLQNIELAKLSGIISERKLAQVCAMIISLSSFATCIVAMVLGYADVAVKLGSSTVIALASIFIVGRMTKRPS